MEPKACIAAYDAATGCFDVYASSQGMSMMLPNFKATFDLPVEKFRLHALDVGGGFGIPSQTYPAFSALMAAARALGNAVKWAGSRFGTIVAAHHRRGRHLGH